ncbi:MAG: HEAT repeat domain-containing protein [candidate division Zixibacteria bacterium]|nr:HEAT repeat domain-containing protein [candidate division Zixibacteria bacterium]
MPGIEVSLDALLNQLSSPDFFEREDAVKQLNEIDADEATAGLVMALEDEDRGIRELAADILVKQGGETCSRLLANFMGHHEISVRNLAAEILVRIGSEAIPALIEALEENDHDIRKFALDVLGLIKDSSVADSVHKMLDDPNENVACSAAETLGYIGTPKSVEPLLTAFKMHEFLRLQAAEALGRIGSPEAYKGLREYLNTDDPVVLYSVIEAMGKIGIADAVEELLPFLEDEREMIADAATTAVIRLTKSSDRAGYAKFSKKRLKKFLIDSLKSDDTSIVQFALQELRTWNEPGIVNELINLILKSDGEIIDQIESILQSVGQPAIEGLSIALDDAEDEGKIKLINVICKCGTIQMADQLAQYADSENPVIRESVASSLGRCGTIESSAVLRKLIKDPIGHVRSAAVKSIGWLGAGEENVDILIECLDDDFPDVREAAMGAMILVGNQKVIETFTRDINHDNPERPRLATIALGMIGEEATREPLILALSHSDPAVRRSSIEALVRLGGIDDANPIRAGLSDENNLVRKAAVTALVALEGLAAIDDIKHLLSDDDIWVRYHTIDSIGSLKNPKYSTLILPFLEDEQDILKIAAIKAIASLGDQSCIAHLRKVVADGNKDLEVAVEEATRALMEADNNE